MTDTNIPFPNSEIVVKIGDTELFPRSETFENETIMFDRIVIEEDMFAESIFGSVEFMDSSPDLEITKGIKTFEDLVVIKMKDITNDLSGKFEFNIVDINISSDLASKRITGPNVRPTKVIVRFASKLFLRKNFDTALLNDFIGKISTHEDNKQEGEFVQGIDLKKSGAKMSGFVQELFKQASVGEQTLFRKKTLLADRTFNDIWFKHNASHYPWSKIGSVPRISQIMNYVSEYACYDTNSNAVNFFFWEDLYDWNFRCIESLIEENRKKNDFPIFTPSLDENATNAIVSFEVMNTTTPNRLLDTGAIISEYVRIKPKWDDVYSDFLDPAEKYSKKLYRYDYNKDGYKWLKISDEPFILEFPTALSSTVRISDSNYGYYSNPYNDSNSVWWDYYDNYNKVEDEIFGENKTDEEPDRLEVKYWRSQFDFCELPGSWLQKIYKEVKFPLIEKRKIYADKKRLKRKWEVFNKAICCIRPIPETFFAVITGAEKIHGSSGKSIMPTGGQEGDEMMIEPDSGGVYAYEWCEVEFWPRKHASEILKDSHYHIIHFKDSTFPFVFVRPKGFLEGRKPADASFSDTRAFNLNETLNSRIPVEFEKLVSGDKPPYTLMINPGVSVPHGCTLATDEQTSFSSYPKNFQMMPVGKFRVIDDKCPLSETSDEGLYPTDNYYYGGRIVQMYRIPKAALTGLRTTTSENIFVFDVDNAHDGLCTDC